MSQLPTATTVYNDREATRVDTEDDIYLLRMPSTFVCCNGKGIDYVAQQRAAVTNCYIATFSKHRHVIKVTKFSEY